MPKTRQLETSGGFPYLYPIMTIPDSKIRSVMASARTIAVVGASPNPARPSNAVCRYLIDHGYEVIPVRPKVREVLGRTCHERLEDIPVSVDIVDVFRRAEACPDIARSAVAIGARMLWLQEGIVSEEAAVIAAAGGLQVVMDRCTKKMHERLLSGEEP